MLNMHRHFSLELPFTRFLRNVALLSLAALIPFVLLFIATRPGFGAMLLDGGPALPRFLRQIITNGLPIVFVVNYISFFLFAWMNTGAPGKRDPALIVVVDISARLATFIMLHALIYVLSADWFGSFAGDRMTALSVVAPTLARSALFENISGAYLYATLVSALPLYVDATKRSARLGRLARRFPDKSGPVIISLVLFLVFILILSGIAALIVHLQS